MKKGNILAAMMFGGSGSGGGLPSVTSADEGKFAYVDENGEWQKGYLVNYSTRLGTNLTLTCAGNTLTYTGASPLIDDVIRAFSSHGYANIKIDYDTGYEETILSNDWSFETSPGNKLRLYVPSSLKGAFEITFYLTDIVTAIYAHYISANEFVEVTLTPSNALSGTVDITNEYLAAAIENRDDIKVNANAIIQGMTSDPSASGMLTPSLAFITNGQATVECMFYLPTDQNTYCVVITNGAYTLTVI